MDKSGIEQAATRLLRDMWQRRDRMFAKGLRPIDLLKPELAARFLNVRFEFHAGLGRFGDRGVQFEVAGFMDPKGRRIAVSRQFPDEVVRFTGAHEVGHWLLHPRQMVYRDRPVKGLEGKPDRRPPEEREADYFSACFLAPGKMVTAAFVERFGRVPLVIDDAAAFWLAKDDPDSILRPQAGSLDQELALATARSYGGRHFDSLASVFRVSPTTMAIRLRELELVSD
jgi:hypothetical protein